MKLVTLAAFARHAGVSHQYIYDEVKRGNLPVVMTDRQRRVGAQVFHVTQLAIDVDADTTIDWLRNPRRGSMAAARRAAKAKGESRE